MDRVTIYPGAIPLETDLLSTNKNVMVALSKLSAAMLGTGTIANGFAVTPTGPASLQVVAAPGEIYSLQNVDGTAYSSIAADTAHQIVKQGILLDSTTLSCPAPTTSGQSINYLVEVAYQDLDANPVVLPYYNASNPSQAYSGPGNNGVAQNTSRRGVALVQVKAGASATTGSQTTPAPDAGYIGLYVVTVAFGQTTITSASISQYSGAPMLPTGLLQAMQTAATTGAADIGAANAYAANFTPAITTLTDKMVLCIKAANANTGASTFTPAPGVIAASPIVGGAHAALQGGEIVPTGDIWLQWNSSIGAGSWILIDGTGGGMQVAAATKSQHAMQLGQATGRLIGVQVFTANGTYTPTAGMVTAVIEAQGGGGAGGGLATPSAGNISLGAPGTSGSYAKGRFTAAAIGASQAVTIGAGGAFASNTAGGNGGTSSVGSIITAPGGVGGGLLNNQVPGASNGNGSVSGAPTGANIAQSIGTCPSLSTSISASSAQAGAGGASIFGGGGVPPVINGGGTVGQNYGSGGSGVVAGSGGANAAGGGGKAGIVFIWEYA